MEQSILIMADILITALMLYVIFKMGKMRPRAALMANRSSEEALASLRKKIDELGGREVEMTVKQKRLGEIIERLDQALEDVQAAPLSEIDDEAHYIAARNLLKSGEPVEKVIEMFNITRGEADVLTSINAMAS